MNKCIFDISMSTWSVQKTRSYLTKQKCFEKRHTDNFVNSNSKKISIKDNWTYLNVRNNPGNPKYQEIFINKQKKQNSQERAQCKTTNKQNTLNPKNTP